MLRERTQTEGPRNRFPAWWTGTTNLFDVPACQAIWAGGIDSLESISGLRKRLQILLRISELAMRNYRLHEGPNGVRIAF
jgi:hypothetical protein